MIVSYSLDLSTLPAPADNSGITIVGAFVAPSIIQDISIFATSQVDDPNEGATPTLLYFTVANSGISSPTQTAIVNISTLFSLNSFVTVSNGNVIVNYVDEEQNNTFNQQLAAGTSIIISVHSSKLPWTTLIGTIQINITIDTYPLANKRVTDLPDAATLTGTEILPVVQGDLSVQTTVADIAALNPNSVPVYETLDDMLAVTGAAGDLAYCKETKWEYIWRTDLSVDPTWFFNGGALPTYPNKEAVDAEFAAGYLNNVAAGTLIPLYNSAITLEAQGISPPLVFGWGGSYSDPFPPLNGALFNITLTGNLTSGSAVITNIDTTSLQGNEYVRSLYFGNGFNTVTINSIDIVGTAGQITVSQNSSLDATTAFLTFNAIDVSAFEAESTYISFYDSNTSKTSFYLFVDPGWQLLTAGGEFDYNFPTLSALRATSATDGKKAFCFETKWTYRWRDDLDTPGWTYDGGALPPYASKIALDEVVVGTDNIFLEVVNGTTVFAGNDSDSYAQVPLYQIFDGTPIIFGLGGSYSNLSNIQDVLFYISLNGNTTLNSNVIANIDTTNLAVGQYIRSAQFGYGNGLNSTSTITITAITVPGTTGQITVSGLANSSVVASTIVVNAIDVSAFFPDLTYIAVEDPTTLVTSFYIFNDPWFSLMGSGGESGLVPYMYIFATVTDMLAQTGSTAGELSYCKQLGVQGDYVWRTDLGGTPGWSYNYPIILFADKTAIDVAYYNGNQLAAIPRGTIFMPNHAGDDTTEILPYINNFIGDSVSRTGYCGTFSLSSRPLFNITLTGDSTTDVNSRYITNIDTTNLAVGQYIRGTAWGFSGNPTGTIKIQSILVVDPVNGELYVSVPARYALTGGTYYVNNIDVSPSMPYKSHIVVNDDSENAGGAQFYQFTDDPGFYLISTKTYANLDQMFADKDPYMAYGVIVSVTDCGVSDWQATQFIVSQGTPAGFICQGLQPVPDPSYLTSFSQQLISTLYNGITIFVISTQGFYAFDGTNWTAVTGGSGGNLVVSDPADLENQAGAYVGQLALVKSNNLTYSYVSGASPAAIWKIVQGNLTFSSRADMLAYTGDFTGQKAFCLETNTNYTYLSGGAGRWVALDGIRPFADIAAIEAWCAAEYNEELLPGELLIDGETNIAYNTNSSTTCQFTGMYPAVATYNDLANINTIFFIASAVFCYTKDTQLLYAWQSGTTPAAVWVLVKAPVVATSRSVNYDGCIASSQQLINFQKTGNVVIATFKAVYATTTSADYITLPTGSIPLGVAPDSTVYLSSRTGINQLVAPVSGTSTTPVDLTFIVNNNGSVQIALGSFVGLPTGGSGEFLAVGNTAGFFDTTLTWTNNS